MTARLLEFPGHNLADIPARLRSLADSVEQGKFDDALSLAYVIDGGDNRIHIGLLGASPEPGMLAYYLYGLAQRELEAK